MARRTAVSRALALDRASIRFARFTQAITSTRLVIPSNSHRDFPYSMRNWLTPVPAGKADRRNFR